MNQDVQSIPYHFEARDYQLPFLKAIQKSFDHKSDVRYFLQIWHRRSGKDKTDIAAVVPKRLIQDPCLAKVVYPTLGMGRDNLWEGIGADGFRYRDHIPEPVSGPRSWLEARAARSPAARTGGVCLLH